MPTYEFQHRHEECNHEWEVWQSIKAPDPTECPKCKGTENIIRLISGGSGKGRVELTGQDLISKVQQDTQQLKKDIHRDEKLYANVLGESKYQDLQTRMDRGKRERRR